MSTAQTIQRRPGERTEPAGTVARVAMMLRVLAESEGDAGLKSIAEQLRLPPSTTHRLLNLLLERGMVERGDAPRTYRSGLEFLRLAGLLASRARVANIARGFMQAVVDGCDETCMLSLYLPAGHKTMLAKVIHGSHALRYETAMFVPTSLAWGATGRGILAFLPQEVIDQVLALREPSPASGRKLPAAAAVKRELAEIRAQGYAHSRGQKIAGAVGLAAPIFNAEGAVIGSLCMTIPETRFTEAMRSRYARILIQQADGCSAALGHRAAPGASITPGRRP